MSGTLGPYELRAQLGRGAMAVVWRAWDPKLEREVAIKEPMLPSGADPAALSEMASRFVREGKAAAALNHPGIVTIYAADVYDGRPAMVMELIEGQTLSEVLERGPLSPSSALAVLDQLLDAAGYAHARGVVHRDIKPDNVFITNDGRVKLADFGIAHVGTGAALTQAGAVMGTPGYMAPEQVTGQPADARADIFAIGVVGYEMLTARNPFGATDGTAPTTVMYRIVHEAMPQLPPQASAGLPADLSAVLATATAKDPSARFGSAQAFRSALGGGAIVAGGPGAGVPGVVGVQQPSSMPSWMPYAVVGAVGVVVIGLLFVFAGGGGIGGGSGVPLPATSTVSATSAVTPTEPPTQTSRKLVPASASDSGHMKSDGAITYGPDNLIDGHLTHAWAEDATGYGIGRWVRVDFGREVTLTEIRVVPGYLKDEGGWNRWWTNGRLKKVTFTFSDGSTQDFTFDDLEGWQTVTLDEPRKTTYVKMTIRSAYLAESWGNYGPHSDTNVSEMAFYGY